MKPASPPPPNQDQHESTVSNLGYDLHAGQRTSPKELADRYNRQHNCAMNSAHSPQTRSDSRGRLVDTLIAPKRFFNYITIEPLAFVAILALYIEFPSIQDLIYTKICLQVVSNHPHLSASNMNSTIAQVTSRSLQVAQTGISSFNPANATRSLNYLNLDLDRISNSTRLPLNANGRIQQPPSTIPVKPQEVNYQTADHFLCDRLNKTAIPKDIRQEISNLDSLFWLKYQLIICILCALSSPYWGGMSDRIGRLIPLNLPILMAVLSNLISLIFGISISMNSHHLFRIEWLYLGALLIGISGGQAVMIVNSFSFISDNTSNESRSKRITILETVIYLSHGAGFFINEHIMKLGLSPIERAWSNRHFVAFSICIILNLFCTLYTLLRLRHYKFHRFLNNFEREQQEAAAGSYHTSGGSVGPLASLSRLDSCGVPVRLGDREISNPDRQRELTSSTPDDLDGPIVKADKRFSHWGVVLTLDYYKQTYVTITKRRDSRALIWSLLLCGFISALSLTSLMSLLYVYLRMDPFNFSTSQYSSWNFLNSIGKGLALVTLTLCMKFVRGWNVPDPLVAAIGFLSKAIGLTMIGLAQSPLLVSWAPCALILSEFSMPPMRSLLSKLVIQEEVGKIYSCLAAIQSLCFLLGNIIFYLAFNSLDLQDFFQVSFLVVAALQFVAVLIMLSIYHHLRKRVIII